MHAKGRQAFFGASLEISKVKKGPTLGRVFFVQLRQAPKGAQARQYLVSRIPYPFASVLQGRNMPALTRPRMIKNEADGAAWALSHHAQGDTEDL
jgi:hypothetical protein